MTATHVASSPTAFQASDNQASGQTRHNFNAQQFRTHRSVSINEHAPPTHCQPHAAPALQVQAAVDTSSSAEYSLSAAYYNSPGATVVPVQHPSLSWQAGTPVAGVPPMPLPPPQPQQPLLSTPDLRPVQSHPLVAAEAGHSLDLTRRIPPVSVLH